MTTALAERPIDTPTVTQEQLTLIKQTVAQGATDAELKLFLFDCARQGVHPLDRLIHYSKRGGKYTPITSIDFMRIRAADTGEMAGSDDPRFVSRGDYPEEATVTVYRMTQGQRFAYAATARWSEYKPDQNDFMWKKMPHTMLGKCAEALALRKGFPRQLAGLYAKEEMDQADAPAALPQRGSPRVDPNVGDSDVRPVRAEVMGAADLAPVAIPVDDELPEGYHRIDDYRPDGNWHHVYWGRDAQGGAIVYKTKLQKIALKAQAAFNDQVPVKLHSKKFPYLDDVEVLDGWPTGAEVAATKFQYPPDDQPPLTDDDIPF